MFSDGLEEFDSSREIVQGMINEYEACESEGYASWGQENKGSTGDVTDDKRYKTSGVVEEFSARMG